MNFTVSSAVSDKPIKDITLNKDDLLQHALEIAKAHVHIGKGKKRRPLLPRLEENMRYLKISHDEISEYVQKSNDIVAASEWFLDNYYIIRDIGQGMRKSFPWKYERELPRLASGEYEGYPRIYAFMIELIEHSDSQLNNSILKEFIDIYQSQVSLSSGELWAIPIMLKIILVENIRKLVEQILYTQNEREKAEQWLSPFLQAETNPEKWEIILNSIENDLKEYPPAYAERLLKRVREFGTDGLPILRWLDKIVSKQDTTIEELATLERQRQAMCQVSMGYAVLSLRYLGEENWPRFFEEVSLVQKILEEDPSGVFTQMDFESRDEYRHQVEKLSRRYGVSELVIARKVLDKTKKSMESGKTISAHVGYNLLGKGRKELEEELQKEWGNIRQTWSKVKKSLRSYPETFFFGSILLTMGALLNVFLNYAAANTYLSPSSALGIIVLIAIPISSLAVPLINWIISRILPPTFLPKLEMREGIPEELKTIVVIPTLLTSVQRVKDLLYQMEVYYLANNDRHLHFALLGDFIDADKESLSNDENIINTAIEGVEKLNQKYGDDKFYLFHRKRLWNESENAWMGWERKRGKLIEFNRLLLQERKTSYNVQIGKLSILPSIKYVITLDADTQLPRGIARKLVGTLSHPLHAPRLSEDETFVEEGYGVLQPRIGVSIVSSRASIFTRIFSGKSGVDPYTTAVSDVYQDLFHEGIFTGKGIYDVKVFNKVTGNSFPENTVLSHDLIEGVYARAGLVTDIELIDGFPSKYHAYMRRLHRWVRGDWQIISWLFKPISAISKWKIFDNLRRSLEAPAQVALILFSFFILPGSPWVWMSLVFLDLLWPPLLSLLTALFQQGQSSSLNRDDLKESLIQSLLMFIMLPYHAYVVVDAIVRSLTRKYITKKHLLEWETAADTEKRMEVSLKTSWKLMWPSITIILVLLALSAIFKSEMFPGAAVLGAVWFTSPWVAYRVSLPPQRKYEELTKNEKEELHEYSRQIWAFFEEYVGQEENWLPPDNVQIDPPNGVAHRTSPTNIGLALLGNLTAKDLGYLSLNQLLQRIDNSLTTLEGLERWQGHFYNWYDTKKLKPLHPLYVSTVDSGNLVVYLMSLSSGLKDLIEKPPINFNNVEGLKTTLKILKKHLPENYQVQLDEFQKDMETMFIDDSFSITKWYSVLEMWPNMKGISEIGEEALFWHHQLDVMIASFRNEVLDFYPWVTNKHSSSEMAEFNKISTFNLCELKDVYNSQLENKGESDEQAKVLTETNRKIDNFLKMAENLKDRLYAMAMATDFKPLFDENRQLFSIGYRISDEALDKSYYDLLASESRQASFIAIAKGDIPQSHWFRLGRLLTSVKKSRSLVSWSGTMFEFLMPILVMRNYEGTLMDETYHSVIKIQKKYAAERNIPWGISESGFYAFDAQLNYQYKAFGVPGLGLKRGLNKDLVVAPYSTFLSLQIAPHEALSNLREMSEKGYSSRYGFYEAADYTPERVPNQQKFRLVKSFMAHHQGMSLLALGNILNQNNMQDRFHSNAIVQATELLLQERVSSEDTKVLSGSEEKNEVQDMKPESIDGTRFISITNANTIVPVTHFVSNGQYSVMLTNAGSGYTRYGDIFLSRWREDVTRDSWGMYFYIQNLNSGNVWSATYQPWGYSGDDYKVTYAPDRVEFSRKDGNIGTRTEVVVSPEDMVEIRRISLTNHSEHERVVEITSYFEVVLAPLSDDSAHPAFSNLFVRTEFFNQILLASRRPRREDQKRIWLMNTLVAEGDVVGTIQYETDRFRFIGRGKTIARPQAMEPNQPLSNTVGAVLDPIMSLRIRIRIKPGKMARVSFSVGSAYSREEALRLAEKYKDVAAVNRAFELAWTQSQMELRHLNISPTKANMALNLGSQLLYLSPIRREFSKILEKNIKGQSALWPYAISGDLPIILVRVKDTQHINLVNQLITVHEYLRIKGLKIDLVILNEDKSSYVQALQDSLRDIVSMGHARDSLNSPGGIFLLQKDNIPEEDVILLISTARIVFSGEEGSSLVQLRKKGNEISKVDERLNEEFRDVRDYPLNKGNENIPRKTLDLKLKNSYGGFSKDGKEYVIELSEGIHTPLPWINVIANPHFGFQVSESGSGFTWSLNSRENKLTPWSNDPVTDPAGEALYLRDEINGRIWSPTPSPIREEELYTVKHGQGYTIFEHFSNSLLQELLLFVPINKPFKVIQLKLKNNSNITKHLTATYYLEWVLGVAREQTVPYIITEYNADLECILARNTFQEEFKDRVGFLCALGEKVTSYTGNRTEFIGRNGSLKDPAGLRAKLLTNTVGAGLDSCGALQTSFSINSQEEKTIYFLLGETENVGTVKKIIEEFQNTKIINENFQEVKRFWDELLGRIQIKTPDDSMDLIVNRWLLYQTVVCRLWARSAFYQSGGAYGFRDQLQDVMSLALTAPNMTRDQIIRHCAHQFLEGDVQHWWHEERGKGIRTKFSDDLLWLPFVTADYIKHTGDLKILDEMVPFIKDEPLAENEDERYSIPKSADEMGSVYEHCLRAIERGTHFGEHGLPLIGSGDWNDGFSRVGSEGKGESVWLGWFLYLTLVNFSKVCEAKEDMEHAKHFQTIAEELKENIERNGWDGGWYRRAYFDDGSPMGSADNEECQIDAIAQSWSVLSGAARDSRAKDAMLALEHYLLRREDGILLLLTPPFDNSEPNPGYIRGYVPGVRENGGQYTHGAIWAILAYTEMGEGEKAMELFHMLNPVNHTRTENEVARYKTEPYVVAADVYAIEPHIGRGGWTWYTGAAGWLYQAALKGILGFDLQGRNLAFNPCIPKEWPGFSVSYRYGSTLYEIEVENSQGKTKGVKRLIENGVTLNDLNIKLRDDGKPHNIKVVM